MPRLFMGQRGLYSLIRLILVSAGRTCQKTRAFSQVKTHMIVINVFMKVIFWCGIQLLNYFGTIEKKHKLIKEKVALSRIPATEKLISNWSVTAFCSRSIFYT